MSDLKQSASGCLEKLKGLGIYEVNLGSLKAELEKFLETCSKLEVKMSQELLDQFSSYLESLYKLITDYSEKESKSPGKNYEQIKNISEALQQGKEFYVVSRIAGATYESFLNIARNCLRICASMEDAAVQAKFESFLQKAFLREQSLNYSQFREKLFDELAYESIPKSEILIKEVLKKYLNMVGIHKNETEKIQQAFNFLFKTEPLKERARHLKNLERKLSPRYDAVQVQELNPQSIVLKVSKAYFPFPELSTDEIHITNQGMYGSPRFCQDRVVLFGRDDQNLFLNDVKLPYDPRLDELLMAIICSSKGYLLSDFSKKGVVFISFKTDSPATLRDGSLLRLGQRSRYLFEIREEHELTSQSINIPSRPISQTIDPNYKPPSSSIQFNQVVAGPNILQNSMPPNQPSLGQMPGGFPHTNQISQGFPMPPNQPSLGQMPSGFPPTNQISQGFPGPFSQSNPPDFGNSQPSVNYSQNQVSGFSGPPDFQSLSVNSFMTINKNTSTQVLKISKLENGSFVKKGEFVEDQTISIGKDQKNAIVDDELENFHIQIYSKNRKFYARPEEGSVCFQRLKTEEQIRHEKPSNPMMLKRFDTISFYQYRLVVVNIN